MNSPELDVAGLYYGLEREFEARDAVWHDDRTISSIVTILSKYDTPISVGRFGNDTQVPQEPDTYPWAYAMTIHAPTLESRQRFTVISQWADPNTASMVEQDFAHPETKKRQPLLVPPSELSPLIQRHALGSLVLNQWTGLRLKAIAKQGSAEELHLAIKTIRDNQQYIAAIDKEFLSRCTPPRRRARS